MNMGQAPRFDGAKVALFLGTRLVVILRDDIPTIPYPGHWDLPGGGREPGETPLACVARELREELGLCLVPHQVTWRRAFVTRGRTNWFFCARMPAQAIQRIEFGSEGQGWALMSLRQYHGHPMAIPRFKHRLRTVPGLAKMRG